MIAAIGGKTLCKILTVADAMPLPIAGSRVDHNCPGTTPYSRSSSGTAAAPRTGHLVSWIRHMVEKPSTNAGRSSHYRTIVR